MRQILPAKRLSEALSLQFDYSSLLAFGESLNSGAWSVVVYSGTDASPSLVITASALLDGHTQALTSPASVGVAGVIYDVVAKGTTNLGRTLLLPGFLSILPDAGY